MEFSTRIQNLQPSAIREILKYTADPSVISFAAGNPAPECFPTEKVAEITAKIMRDEPVTALQYAVSEGYAPLRGYIKSTLPGFDGSCDDIIITAGAQQVMELTMKLFANEGDVIVCEEPSFIGSLNAFRSYGGCLVGAPTDGDGFVIAELERILRSRKAAFIYTIPNFNNPTGRCATLERRRELLSIAERYGVTILEDNPYGELRFSGEPIPSLKELAITEKRGVNIIYAGTFSKILAPGLRVGFMCAKSEITSKATAAVQVATVHTAILPQLIAYRFFTETDMPAYLDTLRAVYRRKCGLMLGELRRVMPSRVTFTEPCGGLFIWADVNDTDGGGNNTAVISDLCHAAIKHRVAIVPGNAFLIDETARSTCFRLNYSTPSDEQIAKGVAALGEVSHRILDNRQ